MTLVTNTTQGLYSSGLGDVLNGTFMGGFRNAGGATVPEPGSLVLAGLALLGLGMARRKQRA